LFNNVRDIKIRPVNDPVFIWCNGWPAAGAATTCSDYICRQMLAMRKVIVPIVLLVAVVFGVYLLLFKKKEESRVKSQPISVNTSDSLTVSVRGALLEYYILKDAFTKSDTIGVNTSARSLVTKLQAVTPQHLKGDPAIVELAWQLNQNIQNEAGNIVTAPGIESKRKVFQVISDVLFDFLRTINYSGSKVYQQYCPMAFNNSGAAWLSSSSEIINPYFGDKMLHCGDIRDSVVVNK
jgi:Cu(I)/Ag(I) efflux system membrane fusion protein